MNHIRRNFDIGRKKPSSAMDEWKAQHAPEISVPNPVKPKKKNKWAFIPFASGALVLVLIIELLYYASSAKNSEKYILGDATAAYGALSDAGRSLAGQEFGDAQIKFSQAQENLKSAQDKLAKFESLALVSGQAKSAEHILSGASYLASAGKDLSASLGILSELKVSSVGVETSNVVVKLKDNRRSLDTILDNLKKAGAEFDQATDVPSSYKDTLESAKSQVAALTGTLESLANLENIYLGFFGSGPRVYLLLFQNYDEIRATGGFIGTYGVLKINDGKIQDLKIDSIYDLDGHIYDQIAAPGPFQPYIKKWGIRDANWFADFPTSARKVLKFFESGSQTADGVIAFTPEVFADLLGITGPIELPGYDVTLTADNFQEVVQFKTSVDYDNKQNPKQMLADFAPQLLDRLSGLDQAGWLVLLQNMQDNLLAKNVLLYSKDADLEQSIVNLKVAGNILPTDGDYLNVVNTNLGGTKSDLSVKQTINLETKILSDGSVLDTLTITRANNALVRNSDFMRVLVPSGATLVAAKGFDEGDFNRSEAEGFETDSDLAAWDKGKRDGNVFVREEAGKTEFSGWVNTESGTSKTVTLVYNIALSVNPGLVDTQGSYSLLFQKQPGSVNLDFAANLDFGALNPQWLSQDAAGESGKIKFNYTTNSDQYWAVVFTK